MALLFFMFRGSVVAKIVGYNVLARPEKFVHDVPMYVYEEMVDGQKLTEIINTKHENVKYLPGCILPDNVVGLCLCITLLLARVHLSVPVCLRLGQNFQSSECSIHWAIETTLGISVCLSVSWSVCESLHPDEMDMFFCNLFMTAGGLMPKMTCLKISQR